MIAIAISVLVAADMALVSQTCFYPERNVKLTKLVRLSHFAVTTLGGSQSALTSGRAQDTEG